MVNRKSLTLLLVFLIFVLTGCMEVDQPITRDSEGFWNRLIVYPLSWSMVSLAEFFGTGWGYGLSIIVLTIIIRLLILPLMINQQKSMKKMQLIQPELQKLREKYSSKDAITQQKLQQAQMQLFEKYDINPLSGCLPLLIQMPILIGFYQAIVRTEQLDGQSFLWFPLDSPDPYFILPVIAGGLTYLQQKVVTRGQPTNPQTTMMNWMLPLMIVVFSLYLPAALPLYWIIGNIFTIVQNQLIKVPELEDLSENQEAATIANRKKTVKSTVGRAGGRKK